MTDFAHWYYGEMPRLLLRIGRGYLRQVYFGFSFPLLLRTFFAPWKRDLLGGQGLSLAERVQVWTGNLVSRFFGMVMRGFALLVGGGLLLVTAGVALFGYLLWLLLPFVVVVIWGLAVRVLAGGLQ